jgi:formamidopyrimidine-DNA glycosylase
MPELPDIVIYREAIARRIVGRRLTQIRIHGPFLLRSFEPPIEAASGRTALEVRTLGKRLAIGLEGDLWIILHLMIAGRLHWKNGPVKLAGKYNLAALDFECGTLLLTEAGAKRRAALYLVLGQRALEQHNPGGLDVFAASLAKFTVALTDENHTLKRVLTDPRRFCGIGNAYSDEILHRAGLSPLALSQKLSEPEIARLHLATQEVLRQWTDRLQAETGNEFPEHVTAFRQGMAVHGRFGQPCPACGTSVQRIRYADNETNYCPTCQTGGRILSDRSLARLLKDAWPRHVDEL